MDDIPLDDLTIDPESTVLSVRDDDDGGVTVEIGKPEQPDDVERDSGHDDNLALDLTDDELSVLAEDILEGIDEDEQSRGAWLAQRAEGIRMLGLDIRRPDATPNNLNGISTVMHPLLLEAVLRFQANARSELLPTDGPVKIRDDGRSVPRASQGIAMMATPPTDNDEIADALQADFNHYLTSVAREYIPSTDQMLFYLGLDGMEFKKVYHDPVRRRPVSEWVPSVDIIVNNGALCGDLTSVGRVTQRIRMRPSIVKRMIIAGAYREVDLVEPGLDQNENAVDQAVAEQQGIASTGTTREGERDRSLFECYCELDLPGFEHKEGLPLPYKVVVDEDSREILEIRRNWKDGDDTYTAKQVFVPYIYVPGPGFYGIGLLHILGNTTNAATAATRMGLDAGMLASFPGGLIAEDATRQDRTNFTVGVGEFARVKTGGGDIRQAVMPFPYKGVDASLVQMLEMIVSDGQRIGGTAEIQVGEGRQDAPVGTTMALLEQSKIPLDAVHKRLHAAQSQEFELLIELFREDPEAFWRGNKKPMAEWDQALLLKALDDYDLVPMADPNTSSQVQRQMKAALVVQLAQAAPQYFNIPETIEYALRSAHVPNVDSLINRNPAPQGPQTDPAKQMSAQAQMLSAQAKLADTQQKAKLLQIGKQTDLQVAQMKSQDNLRSIQDQAADRQSKERLAQLDIQKDVALHQHGEHMETQRTIMGHHADAVGHVRDLQSQHGLAALGHQANLRQGVQSHQQAMQQNALNHASTMQQQGFKLGGEVHQQRVEHHHAMTQAQLEHYHDLRKEMLSHEQAMEKMKAQPRKEGEK